MADAIRIQHELPPLPEGGDVVVIRELNGDDEVAASAEAGSADDGGFRARLMHAMVQRSIVSINGEPFDQSKVVGAGIRNLFRPKDFQLLVLAFQRMHEPTKEEVDSFLAGIKVLAR